MSDAKKQSGQERTLYGLIVFLFLVGSGLLFAPPLCHATRNIWTQRADFGGAARYEAVGFSIGTKGYLGTGNGGFSGMKDFWEYDPSTNTWTQRADFGGSARYGAVGFSIGSKGYIGTGYTGSSYTKDFWEYDPSANTWTQRADFGGESRAYAAGFSIGTKGYVVTGSSGLAPKDFWEYDPSANTWTQRADFEGAGRYGAVGFSIGTKGYVGTGYNGSSFTKDFWEYDPSANTWTRRADFGGTARSRAVGFSIVSKGYIGTGHDDSSYRKDFWEYDPAVNAWTQKDDFGGIERQYAVGFSTGTKGYVGTGDILPSETRDFWEISFPLSPGWNFISLSRQPLIPSIGTVLADVSPGVRIVWGYDNEQKAWKRWAPGGGTNTLLTMEAGKGYWIYMNGTASIDTSGWTAPPASLHLYAGWNLIGYSESGIRTIPEALGNLSGKWRIIWNWDNGAWKGKVFGSTIPTPFDELLSLEKEKAYWIMVTEGQAGDWNQDIAPPSVPEGVTATAASGSQIDLSWNPSADTFQVVGYRIYRGNTLLKSVAGSPASDTGLTPNTQYCYTVSAFDAAGNESARSSEVCATTVFNDTPIISNLQFQPNQAQSYSGNVLVTGYIDFIDQGGNLTTLWLQTPLSTVSAPIQGAAGVTSGTGYGAAVVSTSGPPGTYTFTVWVTDSNGHSSNTLTGQFTLTP
jgi:N-acetylneuraminic acid mutarotase